MANFDRLALLSRRAVELERELAASSSPQVWLPDDLVSRPEAVDSVKGSRREVLISLLLQVLAAERKRHSPPSPEDILRGVPASTPALANAHLHRWFERLSYLASEPCAANSTPPDPKNVVSFLAPSNRPCAMVSVLSPISLCFHSLFGGFLLRVTLTAIPPDRFNVTTEPHVALTLAIDECIPLYAPDRFIQQILWPAFQSTLPKT